MMAQWIRRIGAVALGAALVFGAVGAANAQGSTPQSGLRQQLSDDLFQAVADATGLTVDEVWAEVYDGRTLAEVAEENGADPEAIVSDVSAQVATEIAQAAADGTLTEAQADRWLNRLPEALDHAMYFTQAGPVATARIAAGGVRQLIAAASDETGLTRLEIWQALEDGQTLAAIAEANGSTADAVVQSALASTSDHLDRAAARGRLSEDQAAVLLDQATESYPDLVDQTLPDWQLPARLRGRLAGQGLRLGPGRFVY